MFRYNDEELLYLSRQGCNIAYNQLVDEYYQFIRMLYYKMRINTADEADVLQSTMINCIQAFDSYRPDRNCKLRTFMSWVIRNSILTAVKKSNIELKYYGYSLSESPQNVETMTYESLLQDTKDSFQPRAQLMVKEATSVYQAYVDENCSDLEQGVMEYRLQGYSNQEIAKELDSDIKTVYNAVYRLQKKLEKVK